MRCSYAAAVGTAVSEMIRTLRRKLLTPFARAPLAGDPTNAPFT